MEGVEFFIVTSYNCFGQMDYLQIVLLPPCWFATHNSEGLSQQCPILVLNPCGQDA